MSTTPERAAGRRQAGVLALACLILFVDGYDVFAIGTVGPSLMQYRPWGATHDTLGMLGSVTALGMPFGSVLAGWAADRRGRRLPLTVAVVWISVSMAAATFVPSLGLFAAARFCTGVGIGALAPLVSAYVTDSAPPRRRTLHLTIALGAMGIGGTASALLGRLLLPGLHFQWLFLFGALPILLVPVIRRMVPDGPVGHAGHPGAARERVRLPELFTSGSRRATVLFWCASFMSMALVYSTTAWLPAVMMKSGYDLGSSLEFTIAFTIGATAGGLGGSVIADRGHLRTVTFAGFVLAAVALFVLSTPQPHVLLLAVSALAGLGTLGGQNMVIACMTVFYPARLRGTGLGFGLGIGRLGAIAGPTYVAVATDLFTSSKAGFFAFMVPAVLGAAVIAALPRVLAPSPEKRTAGQETAPVVP
ncbi:MFS transporter [Actinomadura verrucosospora]|uniref:Benzoate MFS transporter BenK n=1 Tax=Actinomadura verrucosospora TaxID=46165 RepID=A0A7D3VPI5_ACTVE|nr:MFS transporter [Actinomadura verrucosospora]QKG18799.1 benzoate MFS transporter BenK [Actinomadura verrucosospora]